MHRSATDTLPGLTSGHPPLPADLADRDQARARAIPAWSSPAGPRECRRPGRPRPLAAAGARRGGVTFVKLGQVLSTRSDVVPASVATELSRLQDQVTPAPWPLIEAVLTRLGSGRGRSHPRDGILRRHPRGTRLRRRSRKHGERRRESFRCRKHRCGGAEATCPALHPTCADNGPRALGKRCSGSCSPSTTVIRSRPRMRCSRSSIARTSLTSRVSSGPSASAWRGISVPAPRLAPRCSTTCSGSSPCTAWAYRPRWPRCSARWRLPRARSRASPPGRPGRGLPAIRRRPCRRPPGTRRTTPYGD